MREATANWNLRKIDLSFPYIRVLVQGRPEHREDFPKHPPATARSGSLRM